MFVRQFVFITLLFGLTVLSGFGQNKNDIKTGRIDLTGQNLDRKLVTLDVLKVKVLILDSCDLLTLPLEMANLKNLEHLSLRYNPKMDWEQAFNQLQKLPKLKFLNLSHNELVHLPKNVVKLIHLTNIRLSHNRIEANETVGFLYQLPRLKWLWLDNNELTQLPPKLFTFSKLRFLYAFDNRIRELILPENSSKMLWVLHLGTNLFETLPLELIQIDNLRMVMFNGNRIIHIPDAFQKAKYSMSALVLDDNPMSLEESKKAKLFFKGFMMYSNESYDKN